MNFKSEIQKQGIKAQRITIELVSQEVRNHQDEWMSALKNGSDNIFQNWFDTTADKISKASRLALSDTKDILQIEVEKIYGSL